MKPGDLVVCPLGGVYLYATPEYNINDLLTPIIRRNDYCLVIALLKDDKHDDNWYSKVFLLSVSGQFGWAWVSSFRVVSRVCATERTSHAEANEHTSHMDTRLK